MNPKYNVIFLMEAMEFLEKMDEKTRDKIIYNIDKSRYTNDPKKEIDKADKIRVDFFDDKNK